MKCPFIIILSIFFFVSFERTFAQKQNEDSLAITKQKAIIDFLHISPQDNIVDIGTGGGNNLIPVTNQYPLMRFTAEDIDSNVCNKKNLLKTINRLGNKTSIKNFSVQYGDEKSTKLPAAGFSKILAFDVIHEMTYRSEMLNDFKRILLNNGAVYIEEILVHKKVKKDRVCNYPYLTEQELKKLLADNHYSIKKEQVVYDTGVNKYIKIFECVPEKTG
ncbi:MAG TPA: class I SAM-dependent methyltransferase [Chitinophagaceae bacterium]|nr:class I SAM-dependent methyltransferase [Chitinophagaceae bacterium]